MTAEFARLIALVDEYLATNDFMALWSPVAGPGLADHEPGPLAPDEEPLWNELYELVYMGQQESATPGEAKDGLVGGPELHARLLEWRAAASAVASA